MAAPTHKDRIAFGLLMAGIYIAFGSLLIPLCQAYVWLRYGGWPELPLELTWQWLGWPFPSAEWVGVEKMLLWLFRQPTTGVVFVIGIIVGFGGAWVGKASVP